MRRILCEDGTADTLCKVPMNGGYEYDSEQEWCEAKNYGTDCEGIREAAEELLNKYMKIVFNVNGIIGE